MDGAYYEEIAGTLRGLVIRLEDRLERPTVVFVTEEIDANELGLALEAIAGGLSERGQPLERGERADMLALAERMQMGEDIPRALALCPSR